MHVSHWMSVKWPITFKNILCVMSEHFMLYRQIYSVLDVQHRMKSGDSGVDYHSLVTLAVMIIIMSMFVYI